MTGIAATFFIVAPRLGMPQGAPKPPILVAILFPAVVFGVVALVKYARRSRP
jgi:hypothetical protein